jgi:phosphoserine phosphatase
MNLIKILYLTLIFLKRRINLILNPPKIKLVLVDLDGTLLKNYSTFAEGLKLIFGKSQGTKIYHKLINLTLTEGKSSEEIMVLSEFYLKKGKFNKKHLIKLNREILKEIDKSILNFVMKLKNTKVIIATKSSNELANSISSKFGFLGGVGSILNFNTHNKFIGTSLLVANKNCTIQTHTFKDKLTLAKQLYIQKIGPIQNAQIAILTDSYADINVMQSIGLAIFNPSENPDKTQHICEKYKLFDKKITKHNHQSFKKYFN